MPNANISIPSGTQSGNFNAMVAFTEGTEPLVITDFTADDITLTAVSGNGITGVTWFVSGAGANYNVEFFLPVEVSGSFRIQISGMVTREGGSSPEGVMDNAPVVMYDDTTFVAPTWGTVEYRDGGVIVLPINFAENVIVLDKSVFEVRQVSGSALDGVEYYVVGENTAWELIFQMVADRAGRFSVDAVGDVLKVSSQVWENVVIPALTVDYDTAVPRIVAFDIPKDYQGLTYLDVKLAYNTRVTGMNDNNIQDLFILEGAATEFGMPTPYKWTGDVPTDVRSFLQQVAPDDLTGSNWTQLVSPPAGPPTPNLNGFDANGYWHGVANEGQYFLIRWAVPDGVTGIFTMSARVGEMQVRGPVS